MRSFEDSSLSALNAGFVTVVVGFTSSVAIVFQAAQTLGADARTIGSWMLALGLGMGLTSIAMSLRWRMPVATAWSTSGAAMLIGGAQGVSMSDAVGCFVLTGLAIAVVGFTGWFERAMSRIPLPLAAGMLSGVLLRFGIDAFAAMRGELAMVGSMFVVYLAARRWLPRYAVVLALAVGTLIAAARGSIRGAEVTLQLAEPVFVVPTLSLAALIGVALPLFVVTMASQNAPAVAMLRASDFEVPVSRAIGWTGIATLLLAPFGAYTLNLATITGAICIGREAHEDPSRRYVAAIFAGFFYMLVGLFGAAVAGVFSALPRELVLSIAGFALLGTIANGLTTAMSQPDAREPALITFLVTASGVSILGIGAAFWGLVAGGLALLLLRRTPAPLPTTERAPTAAVKVS